MTDLPRDTYRDELDDLREAVLAMGEAVLGQLDDALDALESGDQGLAQSVIEGDDAINERYLALESDCVDLIALQQPVAGDLRLVTAAFKIATDLERVGDLATNLAEYATAETGPWSPELGVVAIGREARTLVADALAAFADEDVEACKEIDTRDDEIDAACQRASEDLVRELIEEEGVADAWAVERVLDDVSRLLLTIRDVERIADHAVNVAARTHYAVAADTALIE